MSDVLAIISLVIAGGYGLMMLTKPPTSAYSSESSKVGGRKTRKNRRK